MTLARDALDRQLIALLQMNARMPTAEIARRLGVARSTVHERIARLERERVIAGYTAVLPVIKAYPQIETCMECSVRPE